MTFQSMVCYLGCKELSLDMSTMYAAVADANHQNNLCGLKSIDSASGNVNSEPNQPACTICCMPHAFGSVCNDTLWCLLLHLAPTLRGPITFPCSHKLKFVLWEVCKAYAFPMRRATMGYGKATPSQHSCTLWPKEVKSFSITKLVSPQPYMQKVLPAQDFLYPRFPSAPTWPHQPPPLAPPPLLRHLIRKSLNICGGHPG